MSKGNKKHKCDAWPCRMCKTFDMLDLFTKDYNVFFSLELFL